MYKKKSLLSAKQKALPDNLKKKVLAAKMKKKADVKGK